MKVIADTMFTWARERGAIDFAHWFFPLRGGGGAVGGMLGAFKKDTLMDLEFGSKFTTKPMKACLPAERLFQGETDGSSFPNGGLRVTHSAAAFTTWDRSSPPFARPDLVNTGRTLFGKLPTRHQQGDLNYFQAIPGSVQQLLDNVQAEKTRASWLLPPLLAFFGALWVLPPVLAFFGGHSASSPFTGLGELHPGLADCRQRTALLVRKATTSGRLAKRNAAEEASLEQLTVVQLREKLRKLQLPVSGRKQELISRLNEAKALEDEAERTLDRT
eukprot:s5257_g2.t3